MLAQACNSRTAEAEAEGQPGLPSKTLSSYYLQETHRVTKEVKKLSEQIWECEFHPQTHVQKPHVVAHICAHL